jgi:hypothetical protein
MSEAMNFKDLLELYRAATNPEALREFQQALKARVEVANRASTDAAPAVFADEAGTFDSLKMAQEEFGVRVFTKEEMDRPVSPAVKKQWMIPGIPATVQKAIFLAMGSFLLGGKQKREP